MLSQKLYHSEHEFIWMKCYNQSYQYTENFLSVLLPNTLYLRIILLSFNGETVIWNRNNLEYGSIQNAFEA